MHAASQTFASVGHYSMTVFSRITEGQADLDGRILLTVFSHALPRQKSDQMLNISVHKLGFT
jgi:hypothetical protein